MVKYVLIMLNIGFTKNNANYLINLRMVYTEDFWTLQIEPHTREISNVLQFNANGITTN